MAGGSKDALQVFGGIGEKALGVGELVRRREDKTRAYEIPGYMSRAHDFAVAIADDYADVARLDPELAPTMRKMGGE